jgi:hypothetical protein
MTHLSPAWRAPRLGVFHCTFTGAVVLAVLFLLCWATQAVADVAASRSMLVFFTGQALSSPGALRTGLLMAIVVGATVGAVVSLVFNLFSFVGGMGREPKPPPLDE